MAEELFESSIIVASEATQISDLFESALIVASEGTEWSRLYESSLMVVASEFNATPNGTIVESSIIVVALLYNVKRSAFPIQGEKLKRTGSVQGRRMRR